MRLLAKKGDGQEALGYGRRLRDRGLMTPLLAVRLGDVLAETGARDEALRTDSEIVEFDTDNAASRQALGDVLLRQGWYAAAYRQYKTLTDLDGKTPSGWLRVAAAAAAAGAGRVDEALRIERDVIRRRHSRAERPTTMGATLVGQSPRRLARRSDGRGR